MKKIKGLRRIFDSSRLFRLILEFMDVGMRNTVCRLTARTGDYRSVRNLVFVV